MTAKKPPEKIRVFFAQHKKTGLWKVESPDVKGLMLFDRNREALEDDVVDAVTLLLKEEGYDVDANLYELESDDEWVTEGGLASKQLAVAA